MTIDFGLHRPAPRHLALGLLAALALAAPSTAQADDKQAEADIKAALTAAVKDQALQLKLLLAPLAAQLKASTKAVSSGASAPGDGIDALADAATELNVGLPLSTNTALLVALPSALHDLLFELGFVPAGALAGSGGTLDKAVASLEKSHRATLLKGRKALLALAAALDKQGVAIALENPETPLAAIAPNPDGGDPGAGEGLQPFLVSPSPALAFGVLVGSSDPDVPGDGMLHVQGTTSTPDDAVELVGQGPDGASFGPIVVEADPIDGSFQATVENLLEGNWRVQASQPLALVAHVVGVPGAPDPGTDAIDAKAAAKQAKAGWKSLVKTHAVKMKARTKDLAANLKRLKNDVAGGGLQPGEAVPELVSALTSFQLTMDHTTNVGFGAAAHDTLGVALDELQQIVPDVLVGNGLANDAAAAKVTKLCGKTALKALKSARAFAKYLAQQSDWRVSLDLEPALLRRVAPVSGPELADLPVPLRVDVIAGASQQGVANDGVLFVHATASGLLASDVEVTVSGPQGLTLTAQVPSADAAYGLLLRFPDAGPGTLPEGNYLVTLTQGAMTSSAAISIPGGP